MGRPENGCTMRDWDGFTRPTRVSSPQIIIGQQVAKKGQNVYCSSNITIQGHNKREKRGLHATRERADARSRVWEQAVVDRPEVSNKTGRKVESLDDVPK